MNIEILLYTIPFVVGNFAYQLMGSQDWPEACERSFFQLALALFLSFVVQPN